MERAAVQPGHDRPVDVAGPPSPALGEQHDRQPPPLGELEQPVLLEVVAHALRAGQDRVVVGHDDRGRARRSRRARRRARRPACARSAPRFGRRRSCAAKISGPYSTNVPASTRSATFSRAVRRPCSRRLRDRVGPRRVEPGLVAREHRRRAPHATVPTSRGEDQGPDPLKLRQGLAGGRPCRPRRRRRCTTSPPASATTSCSIFIASTTATTPPAGTRSPGCAIAETVPATGALSLTRRSR